MSVNLRLKMVVNTVARNCDNNGDIQSEDISLSAVYSDKEGAANKQWAKWTPSGQLKFQVNNSGAFGKVFPGQFYFIDLISTDKDSP